MLQSTPFSPAGRYHTSLTWCLRAECPRCGSDLVVRHARQDYRPFIGCGNYPTCRFTCEYDAALQQLARREAVYEQQIAALKYEATVGREMIAGLQAQVRALHAARPAPQSLPLTEDLTRMLTHLIATAHPDRWAQGQPATALAHELTTALLALRTQLQKGR